MDDLIDLVDTSSENEASINHTSYQDSDDGDNSYDDVNDLSSRLFNIDINSNKKNGKTLNRAAATTKTITASSNKGRRRLVKLSSKQNQQYRDTQSDSDSDDADYNDNSDYDLNDSNDDSISLSSNELDDGENIDAEKPKKRSSKTATRTTKKNDFIDLVDTSEDEMENDYCSSSNNSSESEEVGSDSDSEAENTTRRMIQQTNKMKRIIHTKKQYGMISPSHDSISFTSSNNDDNKDHDIVQSDDDDDNVNADNETVISSEYDNDESNDDEGKKNQESNPSLSTTNWMKTKIDKSYYYTLPTTKQRSSSSSSTTITSKENDVPIQYPKIRIPIKLYNKLYDHQRIGVEWIASLHMKGIGGILGDDMGLGKTMQTLSGIGGLMVAKTIRNALVICPKSVLLNWEREARDVLVNYCGLLNVDIVVLDSNIRQEKRERLLLQALNR